MSRSPVGPKPSATPGFSGQQCWAPSRSVSLQVGMTGVEGAKRGLPMGLGLLVQKTVWRVQWWGIGAVWKGGPNAAGIRCSSARGGRRALGRVTQLTVLGVGGRLDSLEWNLDLDLESRSSRGRFWSRTAKVLVRTCSLGQLPSFSASVSLSHSEMVGIRVFLMGFMRIT